MHEKGHSSRQSQALATARCSRRSVRSVHLLLPLVVLSLLISWFAAISQVARGQKRRVRRPAVSRTLPPSSVDYSKFSHATKKHQGACNTCHKLPTKNWQKVREFPDVADYPDHDACVSCHRAQFFRGAKPVICSVCHSKVSPRDDARFAFRNPQTQRQFVIEFPHDKHQDVIAERMREFRLHGQAQFVRTSFTVNADGNTKHYNNCEICHPSRSTASAPATGWPDAFVPDAAMFKAVPASHASCFNCHWKAQQPISENCAGCHKFAEKPYVWIDSPKRISLKFRHAREQHVAECSTCHINITKAATLRGLKPDVPITSCTECHNKDGLRLDVSNELAAIDKDRGFTCVYCHTSDVGRRDPPSSHYLIAGREPMKRKDKK
jgi:hypothetical protein